jgi:thioredoxin 1
MPKAKFLELIEGATPTLVDFSAEWCGPCKMMKPILEEVKTSLGDKTKIVTIDVDRNPQLSMQYQIQSVPTLILFKNGKPVWRQSGVIPTAHLKNIIEANLAA